MSRIDEVAASVRERFPEAVSGTYEEFGTRTLVVSRDHVAGVLRVLKDDFEMLVDLSSIDWWPREPRFEVNYHLLSIRANERLRVKVRLDSADAWVPSAADVWTAAAVQEREVWDMMGIEFRGHPNLARLLMPDEWIGHPLRKDYPVGGVPVEYKIEPAYIGIEKVSGAGRPSRGGPPPRLTRDRGKPSPWTWTGSPAAGVREQPGPVVQPQPAEPPEDE